MKKQFILAIIILLSQIILAQEYQMPVYTATTTAQQEPSNSILKTIDNNRNTIFHSKYDVNSIPSSVDYIFSKQVKSIKKIVYVPNQGSKNGRWRKLNISYSTQENPNTFITAMSNISWTDDKDDKVINLTNPINNPYIIRFEVTQAVSNFSTCVEMEFFSDKPIEKVTSCDIPVKELNSPFENSIKVKVKDASTTSQQPGAEIGKSIDGDFNSMYHSRWEANDMPITIIYNFNGTSPINYFVSNARKNGDNGKLGKISISYNTLEDAAYKELMEKDLLNAGGASTVVFPHTITPLNVKIKVNSGYGNFASIAEIEFFEYANKPQANLYTDIFADELYTKLKSTVTQAQIDGITNVFYKALAQCIFTGKYDKRRVGSYEVYPKPTDIAFKLKVNSKNAHENATGIFFKKGDKIVLFYKSKNNKTNDLIIKDYASGLGGDKSNYQLLNGLNVFTAENDGLAYIQYNDDDMNLSNVELNIVSGHVNGVFNKLTSSTSDWVEMLEDKTYPVLDIIGENVHLVALKTGLIAHVPLDGKKIIAFHDEVVSMQYMLQGLYKYNKVPKNRMLALIIVYGGWNAGGNGINFGMGNDSFSRALDINGGEFDIWGIAHEYGHNNQLIPHMRFPGLIETTNNIFSIWSYRFNSVSKKNLNRIDENEVSQFYVVNGEKLDSPKEMTGGVVNLFFSKKKLLGEPYLNSTSADPTMNLTPFYQLLQYYSMAGAAKGAPILTFENKLKTTHTDGIDYANWHGILSETLRNLSSVGLKNGDHILNMAKYTCDAVQEDLTDFFTNAGFFTPVNVDIHEYSTQNVTITQEMINKTLAEIKSKGYKKPVSPVINYISGNTRDIFRDRLKLNGKRGEGVTLANSFLIIDNSFWQNAVAYEIYDKNDKIIGISIPGTGDKSYKTTNIYYPSPYANKVYAVGYDGDRILVYPNEVSLSISNNKLDDDNFNIYPNPIKSSSEIKIKLKNAKGTYSLSMYDTSGKLILKGNGDINELNKMINSKINSISSGIYVVTITNENINFSKKIIKQ